MPVYEPRNLGELGKGRSANMIPEIRGQSVPKGKCFRIISGQQSFTSKVDANNNIPVNLQTTVFLDLDLDLDHPGSNLV